MTDTSSPVITSHDPTTLAKLVAADFGVKFRTSEDGTPYGEVELSRALHDAGSPEALAAQLGPRPDDAITRAETLVASGIAGAVSQFKQGLVDKAVRAAEPSITLATELGEPKFFRDLAKAANAGDAVGVKTAGDAADSWLKEARERETQARKDLRFLRSR